MSKNRLAPVSICKAVLLILFLSNVVLAHAGQPMPSSVQSCVACHGTEGYSTSPLWPNLAGQKIAYLADQLTAFRDGGRNNPLMTSVVKPLSDNDIQQLAEYYASKPLKVMANGNKSKVDAGEHASAYCVSCHGMKGQTANSEWPNLAGQSAAYLQQQLRAFRDGTRVSTNMNTIVAGYSDQQIEALAAFYSQLQP